MKVIKKSLFIILSMALTQHVFSQAPNISYSPSSITVTAGVPFTLSPTNTGGAVPATTYGQVTTFAGSIWQDTGYVNATGTAALFNIPKRAAMDASGNLYVGDNGNNAIRKISPSGVVTTFAGSLTGASGYKDTTAATSALFNGPGGVAFDASGNLFVSDFGNNAIRKITPAGVVTTFYQSGSLGPAGLSFDSSGNLLVAAQLIRQILKISPSGVVTSIAGDGNYGYVNATGSAAEFANQTDVKMDASGNLIVADFNNNAIRKISPTGAVTTLAGSAVYGNTGGFADGVGTAAKFNNPSGVAITSGGIIYIVDLGNSDIRRIMPDGTVTLIAGSPTQASGNIDGVGTAATFGNPLSIYIDNTGTGYVCDMWAAVRKLVLTGYTLNGTLPSGLAFNPTTGIISGTTAGSFPAQTYTITGFNTSGYSVAAVTLSGVPAPPPNISGSSPAVLTLGNSLSFSPTNTGGAVPAASYSQVTTTAGSTTAAAGYVNATGTAAQFNAPRYVVGGASGNLYIADGSNNAIRMVTPGGVVSTFAGSTSGASGSTDATGTSALFNNPSGLAMDATGNLFVADYGNNSIRKITPSQVVSTFYHSTGTFGPGGMTFDGSGNLIVAAQSLNQILQITPAGVVTTIAGNNAGYVNGTATAALFSNPSDVKMDASGNLFVADYANNAIREITPSRVVSTFAPRQDLQ
jgi:sugar lactone lactonase YvrE